ncbi:MAG TPA: AAA family ATPase [Actinomycetes bacterium]|nr:AAA family ATPase [Actinomycetes bacterium]
MSDKNASAVVEHEAPVEDLHSASLVRHATADVGRSREFLRRKRLLTLVLVVGVPTAYLWFRILTGDPLNFFNLPSIDPLLLIPSLFFLLLIAVILGQFVFTGRSPHVMYRPEQIETRLDDVVGIDPVKEDVVRSLNLFLAHKTFASEMGGTPRRGLLFEGNPGTGKTYLAKAMAAEAGVPFLFVSATSFQSMFYGATAKKIRSYFKALRKAARQEGGAIGFIEEIDAIAMARGGLGATPMPDVARATSHLDCGGMTGLPSVYSAAAGGSSGSTGSSGMVVNQVMSEGVGGVVNELLVQLQSFDEPTGWQKARTKFADRLNLYLPLHRQLKRPQPPSTNLLLIAATNRADNLDPALLRPGRFDRRLTFELPSKSGRRALIDHFLTTKAHDPELDDDERRNALAGVTQGYSPVMIEHLFDEALVNAVRRGEKTMSWHDVDKARLVEEVGMGQPVAYTDHEKRLIATHEAGHATVAWLVAPERRLEVLTIIKRRSALGMLAHGDKDEVYTRSRKEMTALIQIAMGGQVAEELFFGDVSTGPGGDLLYATNVAAEMTGSCGMGETLISYAAIQNSAFSDTNIVGRVLGDAEGRGRVEELLQRQKVVVRGLLESNMHLVGALRDALVERHELIGTEITDVLEAAAEAGQDGSGDGGSGDDGRTIDLRTGRRAGRSARIDPPA